MISPTQLSSVAEAVAANANLAALRSRFTDMHFSECSEDDVSPRYRAAFEVNNYALYLITGATGHCLELTNNAASATGILLAAKVDDAA